MSKQEGVLNKSVHIMGFGKDIFKSSRTCHTFGRVAKGSGIFKVETGVEGSISVKYIKRDCLCNIHIKTICSQKLRIIFYFLLRLLN